MKRIFFSCLALCLYESATAQDNETKNVRLGLKVAPSISWLKPSDKNLETDGALIKFAYGLTTDFKLTNNIFFATGIDIAYSGGKVAYPSNDSAYAYKDGDAWPGIPSKSDSLDKIIRLSEQKYNMNYIEIPLILKMKTEEIGYLTYFGQFGINPGFLLKASSDYQGYYVSNNGGATPTEGVDVKEDAQFMKIALNIGAGAEYNLAGNTSLVIGLSFMNGFSSILQKKSEMIRDAGNDSFNQDVKQKAFVLNVGVMF